MTAGMSRGLPAHHACTLLRVFGALLLFYLLNVRRPGRSLGPRGRVRTRQPAASRYLVRSIGQRHFVDGSSHRAAREELLDDDGSALSYYGQSPDLVDPSDEEGEEYGGGEMVDHGASTWVPEVTAATRIDAEDQPQSASQYQSPKPSRPVSSIYPGTNASARTCGTCGMMRMSSGEVDLNCCYQGGSWHRQCGPRAAGWAFSWKEGFRICNNISLPLEPPRKHVGPFLPWLPWVPPDVAAATSLPAARAYLITLRSKARAEAKARQLQRRLTAPGHEPLVVTIVRGVRARDALRIAGVSPSEVRAVFGVQVDAAEFLPALGCTLAHLRAVSQAHTDGVAAALILEDDAVLDLQPFWPEPSLARLIAALPRSWEITQLGVLATQTEWDEARAAWRAASQSFGSAALLRRDYYWSSAAYLISATGVRRLLAKFAHKQPLAAMGSGATRLDTLPVPVHGNMSAADSPEGWHLGTDTVTCVKADSCVLYPSLSPAFVFVAVPPLFTCAERAASSAITGHDRGVQREVHVLSRMQSLDFAAQAAREHTHAESAELLVHDSRAGALPKTSSEDRRGMARGAWVQGGQPGDGEPPWQEGTGVPPLAARCPHLDSEASAVDARRGRTSVVRPADGLERAYVLRRLGVPSQVIRLEAGSHAGASVKEHAVTQQSPADLTEGVATRLTGGGSVEGIGRWLQQHTALLVQWDSSSEKASLAEVFCQRPDGSPTYTLAPSPSVAREPAALRALSQNGAHAVTLTALLPPTPTPPPKGSLSFRFWIHDDAALWWRRLLQCTPDWDAQMDAQNAAEVWLLQALLEHPDRTSAWEEASVVVLPLLPLTSLRAGWCLGATHAQRLHAALGAMSAHPAYARRNGHDHVVLFNYWDAWGVFGGRGSTTHTALANISFGWHETQDAAWGMANHRHVGKCQIALPYVEPATCTVPSAESLSHHRPVPLYFSGAASDFDTERGRGACPNVERHSVAVRTALLGLHEGGAGSPGPVGDDAPLAGSVLEAVPHNLRQCNGSHACEAAWKTSASHDYMRTQLCAVASGDTPSTGRLYDALACGCVPMLITDDLQLPFPYATGAPSPSGFGIRVAESAFLAAPTHTVAAALTRASADEALRRDLARTRELLGYRNRRNLVATLALRELWTSCIHEQRSTARPIAQVMKC